MVSETVFYRIRKINGKYYLYKEWYDPSSGKRRSKSLGNCEELEKLVVGPPPGFEPGTSGSTVRRSPRLSYGGRFCWVRRKSIKYVFLKFSI